MKSTSRFQSSAISCLALASAATAAACGSPAEGTNSSASAVVVDAGGSEDESHLTLQLPGDACLPGAVCARVLGASPAIFVDGSLVSLGADTRLRPGPHAIAVNGVGGIVTTDPGQALTLVLPILSRSCEPAPLPAIPHTDFGGRAVVGNAPCPATAQGSAWGVPTTGDTFVYRDDCSRVHAFVGYPGRIGEPACGKAASPAFATSSFFFTTQWGQCVAAGPGYAACVAASTTVLARGAGPLSEAYQAYPPGTLTAEVAGTPQTLTLKAGDEASFHFVLPVVGSVPPTFETRITFDEPRHNPDAVQDTILSTCPEDAWYQLPAAPGGPPSLDLYAFVSAGCTYTLFAGGRTQTLSQTSKNDVHLHRLDVNGVVITREDGSTYVTSGTYTVSYDGSRIVGPAGMGTGVDLFPGTYQLSISYTDFEGPKTQTRTITF